MNHCYRLVFNRSTQVWQVVSEIAKSHSKSAAVVLLPLLTLLNQSSAMAEPASNALPTGGQVVSGQSAISQNGNQLNIVQSSQKSIINWQSYNIGSNAEVNYVQSNASSISLNRVTTGDPSAIFGKLNANGQVWLINPNGVLFGKGAQVNVGGLLASTLNIADDDFNSGRYQFTGGNNSVVNMGAIAASQGGYVAMLAPEVRNEGVISAMQGTVALAAGNAMTLDFNGNGLVNVQVDSASVNTLVENKHLIQVGNGQVLMSTKAANGLITSVINNSGKIEANSMVNEGGVIRLTGAKTVINIGEISATSSVQKGGTVHLLGENVGMFNSGSVNVSGKTGGGTILVGGDYQGKNVNVQNASKTFVHQDAKLIADATENGDGGTVIVWADDIARYYGSVSAKGGAQSGNGGFVEISGKRLLNFLGNVDLSATNGIGGNLLLDPLNITISDGADTNTTGFDAILNADITEAFADDAGLNSVFNVSPVLGVGSFAGITAGSTITLQATNDITIASAFNVATATGSANNSLVLEANNNINVNAALTLDGNGALTLRADADNNGMGDVAIAANITTQNGGVTLSGNNITHTVGNISTVGANGTDGGNVTVTSTQAINLDTTSITTTGGNALAGSSGHSAGNITLNAGSSVNVGAISASGSIAGAAGQNGGNGGVVNITANTGVNYTGIIASGNRALSGDAKGGDAGIVNILNMTTGNISGLDINSRTGNSTGAASGGVAGSINVTNQAGSGNITLGTITTTGGVKGNGGTVTISSEAGVTLNSTVTTTGGTALLGTGNNAGDITIAGENRNISGTITANGSAGNGINQAGGNAGAISITGTGTLNIAAVNVRTGAATGIGASGLVGSVNLSGSNIIASDISASGQANGNGGSITVNASELLTLNGAITSDGGAANVGSAGKNAGAITLTGNVITTAVVATITASGSDASGADQAGGNAAEVTLNSTEGISVQTITANGGNAGATDAKGGNAGSITLATNTGSLSTDLLSVRTGASTGTGADSTQGFISVTNTNGSVAVDAVDTRGEANGHGGNLTISGGGAVTIDGSIRANGAGTTGNRDGRNGGVVSITGGSVTTTTINTSATAGSSASQAGGNAGAISINATVDAVDIENITATGGNGNGVNGNGGSGGSVLLNAAAGATITIRNIDTTGGNGSGIAGSGGNITLNDNVLLAVDSTITSIGGNAGVGAGGTIQFNGTVNSNSTARSLVINSNGNTTFAGAVGHTDALASISTDAGGVTLIDGGSVATVGAQTYNDALSLGVATTFSTTNSDVNFASSINTNGNNLVVDAGVGSFTAIDTANDFGNLAITASSANVRDANAIVLGAIDITGAFALQTAGNITQTASVIVGDTTTLNAGATGDITLTSADNDFSSVALTDARNVNLTDFNALSIDAATVNSIIARTLSGNLTLAGNITASGNGDAIVLASAANFLNPASNTLNTSSGRWLIYANTHTGNIFGGLISGNQAIYGRSFAAGTVETGNRYVFAGSPTLTFTSTDLTKNYGENATAAVADAFQVSGFVDAASFDNVFTQDTVANTTSGTPGVTSTGSAATASVAGSPYAITVDITPVTFTNGYTGATASTGELTVNAAELTITANNQTKTYGDDFIFAGTEFTSSGLVNGETIGNVTLSSAGAMNTANVAGSPYDITINNASAGTFDANNYDISYVDASFEVERAPLIIAANNASKLQGSANPAFSSTITGFVNNETDSVFIGTLNHMTNADNASPVGTYTITPSGVTANNYAISFIDGTLSVTEFVSSDDANNLGAEISAFNNAITRPEQSIQTCQSQGAGQAMINGLDEFGVDDVDYQSSISQPQVGGVIANALAGASCSKL